MRPFPAFRHYEGFPLTAEGTVKKDFKRFLGNGRSLGKGHSQTFNISVSYCWRSYGPCTYDVRTGREMLKKKMR